MDDTMLSPFFQLQTLRTDQLITLPFLVCRSFLVGCFVLGFGFCVFWFALFLVLVVFSLLASGQLTGLCTGPTSVQLLKPTFVKLMTSLR